MAWGKVQKYVSLFNNPVAAGGSTLQSRSALLLRIADGSLTLFFLSLGLAVGC
jgi:Na+/H+ antiporter NhaA